MQRKIRAKYVRIAPRKARLIMDLVKGKSAGEALEILRFLGKAGSEPISKMIESAVNDARRKDPTLDVDGLVIKQGWVDQGPALKRRRPRARGFATLVKKYFSHLGMVLSNEE